MIYTPAIGENSLHIQQLEPINTILHFSCRHVPNTDGWIEAVWNEVCVLSFLHVAVLLVETETS